MALITGDMLVGGVLETGDMIDTTPVFISPNVATVNNWASSTFQVQVAPVDAVLSLLAPVVGVSLNASTKVVTFDFRGEVAGDRTFTLRATYGGITTDQGVTVGVDGRPVFFNGPSINVPAGALTPIVIEAQDPEGAVLALSALAMPSGLVFTPAAQPSTTANGLVYTGSISGSLAGGVHICTLRAVAANGGGQTDFTLTINAASAANLPPVITSGNVAYVVQGSPVQRSLTATDANGDSISWSLSSAYPWVTRSGNNLVFSPGHDIDPGEYQVVVTANDGQATVNQTIMITVIEAVTGPGGSQDLVFTTPSRRTVVVGRVDRGPPQTFEQDPVERYDYLVDVLRWLEGDELQTVIWTVDQGLNFEEGGFNEGQARVWLTGGAADSIYKVMCTMTSVGGRTHKVWFYVSVSIEDA